MTTALDSALRPVARDLINSLGTSLTLSQTGAVYDPATAGNAHTPVSQTVKGSPPSRMRLSAESPNVERGDLQTVISPLASGWSFVPSVGDVLTYSSKSYAVMDVWPLNSGDQVAAYKLQLRA